MKPSILFFLFLTTALVTSCNKNNPSQSKTQVKKENQKSKNNGFEKIKYISKYRFEDFPVNKIETKNPKVIINTNVNSFTRRYRTMIKEMFKNMDVNFSGKYIIDYWGCGSPCGIGIAINGINGKLIELPPSSVGYRFKKDSRLLIVNPPDSLGYIIKDCSYCEPEFYHLDTLKSKFVKLK